MFVQNEIDDMCNIKSVIILVDLLVGVIHPSNDEHNNGYIMSHIS